jgi:hypothetical protein
MEAPSFLLPVWRLLGHDPAHLPCLPVNFIMAADIKQYDFLVGNDNGKGYAIAVGDADGLNTFEIPSELVIFQVWLEWIFFQFTQNGGKLFPQIRMAFYKFFG